MTEDRAKRKLTAILSADVKGYSRLMVDDEEGTVRTINAYREVMTGLIKDHRGRVVDAKGDNVLAEFSSVVDAVRCAVQVQKELTDRNSELPEHRRMEFRIGINLGDVIEEEETIYGDGVNVAARLEGLADPGGLCISGTAFDHVRDKLELGYEYLGEQSVKNIPRPVRSYKVIMAPEHAGEVIGEITQKPKRWRWVAVAIAIIVLAGAWAIWNFHFRPPPIEPASLQKMAYPLPDKPSIAVLPFTNISGDPKQDYVADGLTEEIITALAKIPRLFVIASNSVFTYKGKPVKVQQVSEELGVRYVLEGSVRKAEDQVRITAQLIDAVKGNHLWAEKYEGEATDLFSLQDDITRDILTSLEVKLTEGEQARIWRKSTTNPKAYDLFLQSLEAIRLFSKGGNVLAREKSEESLELEPDFAAGLVTLGWTYLNDVSLGWSESPKEDLEKSFELAQKAVSLYDDLASPHALLGSVYLMRRKYDEALSEGKRAVELGPNQGDIVALYGSILRLVGRYDESIEFLERAVRLNPMTPNWYFGVLASAYHGWGNNDRAIQFYNKVVKRNPNHFPAWVGLTSVYMENGEDEKAHQAAKEVLRRNPKFSVETYIKASPAKDQAYLKRFKESLIEAGLPRTPPLPLPDKPSIAVLPFDNLSNDPEQEYFSDGMTDDIITDLSKISGLIIISRNSTFALKGKKIKIPDIAKDLGVKYILEGSVRKADDMIRINAQLIDATTDHHLWAERFDGKNENIFELQDKITARIVSALAVKLSDPEQQTIAEKGTDNIFAYEAYLKGMKFMRQFTPEDYVKAIESFKKAIELDQNYSDAYANLAYTYFSALRGGKEFWDKIGKNFPTCRVLARHYLESAMKKPTSRSYQVLARMELFKRHFTSAIDYAKRAVAISPNDADALETLGHVMVYIDNPEAGIKYFKRSIMLDPLHKSTGEIGVAYFSMGNYEQAVKYIEKALKDYPKTYGVRGHLASAYAHIGNEIKAKKTFKEYFT